MSTPSQTLRDPWLIAAWPGMGRVALVAAQHLIGTLPSEAVLSLERREYFEIASVTIDEGVVQRPEPPKSVLHAVRTAADAPRDLLVFTGDAQPNYKGYEFCHELIDKALARGVRRIVTFAALGTPIHPSAEPRVFGVASETRLLSILKRHDVGILGAGQITGLNGVLLAAAAERGVEGLCLLGEFPGFAASIPNPKASLAVLRAFERISGIDCQPTPLEEQAKVVERGLIELVERMSSAAAEAAKGVKGEGDESGEQSFAPPPSDEKEDAPKEQGPSPETLAKVEALFRRALQDRSQAMPLKQELDRLGLFRRYEDRFLDLFKSRSEERG